MKKIFFLYLFLCLHFSLNAQKKDVDFFSLPFVQEAKTLHDFELKNISGCSLFYVPDINLYVNADFNGDFEDNFTLFRGVPTVKITQNLPGIAKLQCLLSAELSDSKEYDFKYSLSQSVSLSFPLINTPGYIKLFHNYGMNNYKIRKKNSDISYLLSLNKGVCRLVSEAGNYLYYKRMLKLYEEKLSLLEQQTDDYEKLFVLGKINAINVHDQISEKLKFIQEKVELQGKYIAAEKSLKELGAEELLLEFDLKSFVEKWKEYCKLYHRESFLQDEQNLLALDINHFSYVESVSSSIPSFSAGFSINSPFSQQDFPDFSQANWNINVAFNIPLKQKAGLNSIDSMVIHKNMTLLEKQKLMRSQKSSKQEREGYVLLYDSYCKTMQNASNLEKNRLDSYTELNKAGKLSDFDLKLQENNSEIYDNYADYAELQLLVTLLSCY